MLDPSRRAVQSVVAEADKHRSGCLDTYLERLDATRADVEQRNETMCEVYLLATGTHCGPLDCGADRLEPTNADIRVHARELLDIYDGRIIGSALAVDLNDLIGQLATIDYEELAIQLGRIAELGDELLDVVGDGHRRCEIIRRLGTALDTARRALLSQRNQQTCVDAMHIGTALSAVR